jgi:hypothetical protein
VTVRAFLRWRVIQLLGRGLWSVITHLQLVETVTVLTTHGRGRVLWTSVTDQDIPEGRGRALNIVLVDKHTNFMQAGPIVWLQGDVLRTQSDKLLKEDLKMRVNLIHRQVASLGLIHGSFRGHADHVLTRLIADRHPSWR